MSISGKKTKNQPEEGKSKKKRNWERTYPGFLGKEAFINDFIILSKLNQLNYILHIQLLHKIKALSFDCTDTLAQPFSNIFIAHSFRDQLQNLHFFFR